MIPLCSCGQFHEPCAADRRLTAIAAAVRADPRIVAAKAASEAAWKAYSDGRDLPLKERDVLERAWRAAVDAAGVVASDVWVEKRSEHDAKVG